jgi:hypothetical protein
MKPPRPPMHPLTKVALVLAICLMATPFMLLGGCALWTGAAVKGVAKEGQGVVRALEPSKAEQTAAQERAARWEAGAPAREAQEKAQEEAKWKAIVKCRHEQEALPAGSKTGCPA